MQQWAPVVAAAISAPVAAVAALTGVWLQAHLSRSSARTEQLNILEQEHQKAVRSAVSEVLAAIDVAAEIDRVLRGALALMHTHSGGLEAEDSPDVTEPSAAELDLANRSAVELLTKANQLRTLEPTLMPEDIYSSVRRLATQTRHSIHTFPDSVYVFGDQIYSLLLRYYEIWRETRTAPHSL